MVRPWLLKYLVEPTARVLKLIATGDEVRDLDSLHDLAVGVEGLLRTELDAQYAPWPPESTTDGFSIDLCVKSADQALEVVGMCWIDFDGRKMPVRAVVELTPDHTDLVIFTAEIGNTGSATGMPPRLPSGSIIIPARDERDKNPIPELLLGHRLHPIEWTEAIVYRPASWDEWS